MGILSAISAGLKAVAAYFGWAKTRSQEENSPAMQSNAEAKAIQADANQASQDAGNADALGKDLAP